MNCIKGIIFDYGGTLDTAGCHWGQMLWSAYQRQHVPVSYGAFRDAYVHAERMLGRNPIIKPDYTFHRTLSTKIQIEMEYLLTNGEWDATETEFHAAHKAVLDDLYAEVGRITRHSAGVLEELSKEFPMVLVSNFYGNIHCVLKEFGFDGFFLDIVESATAGIRKPDPRIFELGVEALTQALRDKKGIVAAGEVSENSRISSSEVLVVGDSFYKDILPAQKAGCKTAWFKGKGWTDETYDESIPDIVITDLSDLLSAIPLKQNATD